MGEHSYISAGYIGYRESWTWTDEQVRRASKGHTNSINARVYVPDTPLVLGYGDSFADDDHFATYMLGLAPIEGLLVYTYYWREDDIKSRTNLQAEYVKQLADEHAVRINASYTDAPDGDKMPTECRRIIILIAIGRQGFHWGGTVPRLMESTRGIL